MNQLQIATIQPQLNGSIRFDGSAYKLPAISTTPHSTIRAVIDTWPHNWMFKNLEISGNELELATAIRDGTALAVCDGSYMPKADKKRGSTCLIIECQLTKARLMLVCAKPRALMLTHIDPK